MYRSTESPSLLQRYYPVAIVWPPVANDNDDVSLRDASIAQLTNAIRCRIEAGAVEQRECTAELAVALLAYKLLGRSLSYARGRS